MNKIISIERPQSQIAEIYKGIRTNIEFSNIDKNIKVINITSTKQGEGKSTVIANLAVTFANSNKRVLILDGDLRNPTVHKMFQISNKKGITDVLRGHKTFIECINTTQVENLHVVACGTRPQNPSEILGSQRMKDLVKNLRDEYDYIFIDTSAIGIVTDAGIVSTYTDGTIFVVASQDAKVDRIKEAKKSLEMVNANILGVVLNKTDIKDSLDEYYYVEDEPDTINNRSRKSRRNEKKKLIDKLRRR